VLYVASILMIAGVALFVAAPLITGERQRERAQANRELARAVHQRALTVQALRELEFDREMNKMSEVDCAQLRRTLEALALAAMVEIERFQAAAAKPRVAASRPKARVARPARAIRFCPACGTRVPEKANFCGECGVSLRLQEHAS
jgi:hypothetical protein